MTLISIDPARATNLSIRLAIPAKSQQKSFPERLNTGLNQVWDLLRLFYGAVVEDSDGSI